MPMKHIARSRMCLMGRATVSHFRSWMGTFTFACGVVTAQRLYANSLSAARLYTLCHRLVLSLVMNHIKELN